VPITLLLVQLVLQGQINSYYENSPHEKIAPFNSISIIPTNTNLTAKFKMCIFSDVANSPNTLLSDGTEVVGTVSGTVLTGNLTSPQTLTGGTPYWLGFIIETNINFEQQDNGVTSLGFTANNTYTSGVPGTAPAMTGLQSSWLIWGNVTSSSNWAELQNAVASPLVNYLTNTAVGDEDLYTFGPLSSTPLTVSAVQVSTFCAKSDGGSRNIDLRVKSGVTDDPGNHPNQPVVASFTYLSSIWDNDPDTGLAWSETTVNNATSGVKVSS
jgi:hypothetical protein